MKGSMFKMWKVDATSTQINFIFLTQKCQKIKNLNMMGTEFFRISKTNLKTTLTGTFKVADKELTQIPFHLHKESMNKIISEILGT